MDQLQSFWSQWVISDLRTWWNRAQGWKIPELFLRRMAHKQMLLILQHTRRLYNQAKGLMNTMIDSQIVSRTHFIIIIVSKLVRSVSTCPSFSVIWPCSLQPMNVLLHLNTWSPARNWWAKAAGKKPILSSITPWRTKKCIHQNWK